MIEINDEGVPCFEVYLENVFDSTGWRLDLRLPMAKELGETSLMFLIHPTLTAAELDKTCNQLIKVATAASLESDAVTSGDI